VTTTTIETKLKQERLLRIIEDELQDLPPLPAVVIRVMQTINDPTTSAADLNRLISSDQAIASKVLRLVNSSYYGFPRRISTITHAVVILGFNTVRNLTTSLGVLNAFDSSGRPTALDRSQFWAHSIGVAVAAGVIAKRKAIPTKLSEEVFVGGLLHDIGKLFLDQYFPDQYAIAVKLARAAKISIWDAEKTALGVGHALVGKRIAEKWNLPPSLTSMVTLHHQPAFAKEHFEITAVVHTADRIAHKLSLGHSGSDIVPELAPEVQQWLALPPQVWDSIEHETIIKFAESKEFLKMAGGM
jgi:putative nucleotidyltransferase with HDIG domain